MTPGEWTHERHRHGFSVLTDEGFQPVVATMDMEGRYGPIARLEDAYVLAASKRLYEALRGLVSELETLHVLTLDELLEGVQLTERLEEARRALAKARGELHWPLSPAKASYSEPQSPPLAR